MVWLGLALALHDGPDPVVHYQFHERNVREGRLRALLGPDAQLVGQPKVERDALTMSMRFPTTADKLEIPTDFTSLPKRNITVEAWAAIDEPAGDGGFLGYFQDNGNYEKGWVLGYNDRTFTWAVAGKESADADGDLTYLAAKTPYVAGKFYHVVGTYDGTKMRIYVNGKLEASSREQKGDILYPPKAKLGLGRYLDENEDNPLVGRLHQVPLYDLAATSEGVEHLYEHKKPLSLAEPATQENPNFEWVVQPYMQYPTQTSIKVMWETSRPSTSRVSYGLDEKTLQNQSGPSARIHDITLAGLKPDHHYVYQVETTDDQGRTLKSELLTFRTAPEPEKPIRFAVVGDTQDQPKVNHQIANWIWGHRPDFWMIVGDLVGTGGNKRHWTEHFFGSMRPLLSRVPLFPVLGNHENDARLYYDYFSVPTPEYYYSYRYGPAEIFVIDSQRNVNPGSEQYKWLDQALAKSTARWKFAAHHFPPYSSDEDDYGNRWKGQSTWGDVRIRQLAKLYEKHKVDMVFTGHIHSYERTWPILNNTATDEGGVIYVVCGGGGGGLETPAPTRPWFSNMVRYGHHYTVVSLTPTRLEYRAHDIEGRLFDQLTIHKPR